MRVGRERELNLIIHSSYVLQSHRKQWINKYRSTVPRRNTALGSCKPLFTTFLSSDQYITLFHVCFCLNTSRLLCWFTNRELTAVSTMTQAWMELLQHMYFLHKAIAAFLKVLRNTRHRFCTMLEGYAKQGNHQWKAQKCEKRDSK